MKKVDRDPELLDDPEEGVGDAEVKFDLPEYDESEFELPDDYEYVEVDEDGSEE